MIPWARSRATFWRVPIRVRTLLGASLISICFPSTCIILEIVLQSLLGLGSPTLKHIVLGVTLGGRSGLSLSTSIAEWPRVNRRVIL